MFEAKSGKGEKAKISMPPVPFNHAAHEKYSDNCRVCHHASMDACSKCHTLGGSKEGGNVTFEQAMHRTTSQQSCEGCHAAKQASPNCSGCHNNLAQAKPASTANCQLCHMSAPGTVTSPQQKSAIAESMLKSRKMTPGVFASGDIPEKVVIGDLSDKYEPVQMDHLKHVNKLLEGSKDSHWPTTSIAPRAPSARAVITIPRPRRPRPTAATAMPRPTARPPSMPPQKTVRDCWPPSIISACAAITKWPLSRLPRLAPNVTWKRKSWPWALSRGVESWNEESF